MKWLPLIALVITLASSWAFQSPLAENTCNVRTRSFSFQLQLSSTNLIDIDEKALRDVVSMEQWATTCGVQQVPSLYLQTNTNPNDVEIDLDILDYDDVAILTTQDIIAGSSVHFVPSNLILSSQKAFEELGHLEDAETQLKSMDATDQIPYFYLLCKILWEYTQGPESPWFPWLDSLPRYFSNAVSMTSFCYECLPPLVASLARKEQANFISFYLALQEVPLFDDDITKNMALVKWAYNNVYTRSVNNNNNGGDIGMVPMADLFNHGTYSNVAIGFDEQGNCYAQTTTNVPAGSPLTTSYGDPTNPSFLFARYGFIDKSSPSTFCKIMVEEPIPQPMIDLGYDHSRMLFYKDTGEVSPEVWDVLLYQLLEASPEVQQTLYHAHMAGDWQTKQALHQQFHSDTMAALLNHIDSFLHQLEVLSQKSKGKNLSEHPRLPIILQHNNFVKESFLAVRRHHFGA